MKTFCKTLLSLGTLLVFTLLFIASATQQNTTATQRTPAHFDYTPPTEGYKKSDNIFIALIAPQYAPTFLLSTREPYVTFVKSMSTDFVEMLTARGYPYIGPFSTHDEMVYGDKKRTDLVLSIEVDIKLMTDNLYKKQYIAYPSGHWVYYADGEFIIDGKLNLFVSEPFTKTKVWVKSIPIEPIRRYVKSSKKYSSINDVSEDPELWNAVVETLKEPYKKTMTLAWNHLDPTELEQVKKEAFEIKQNSGFIKN